MNFTETFNDFSASLGPMDIALYGGVGIVLWVLFKDKLSPVQKTVLDLFNGIKSKVNIDGISVVDETVSDKSDTKQKDLFFDLVVSWKQTRDLAVRSGCNKAVEVADSMFPYLSPTVCGDNEKVDNNAE